MAGMRSLTRDHRLQALSVADITEPFEDAALALGRVYEFNGRKLKAGPLLNAVVLRFLEMSEAERSAFAAEYLARLEARLAETEQERAAAEKRLPKQATGQTWLPGAVRDQTSIDQPPPRRRTERQPEDGPPPPVVNETRVLPQPRKRKRPEAG